MNLLINGLITGMLFGFLLQKGRVVRYDKQIGALRLQDMTIVKFMFSSILVGMVGLHFFDAFGLVTLMYMPTLLVANIAGGLLFGIGWGILGYCPGTQGGALGEGRWDSLWGILGMLLGAVLYAESYPWLAGKIIGVGNLGYLTLPMVFRLNTWVVIALIVTGGIFMFRWLERHDL